jgi:PTS system ascorbate-specific IIA component
MNTGLLLITHGNLGKDMLNTARSILGDFPIRAEAISVRTDCEPESMFETASRACARLDEGGGVLVLTDLYGSTPSNIATRLIDRHPVHVISGVNIPMLLRVMNYPELGLEKLAEKAASGARDGIVITVHKQAS